MSAPLSGSITRQLREVAAGLEPNVSNSLMGRLLDLANATEVLEDNLTYLLDITACSAEQSAELKGESKYRLARHHSILEDAEKMASGTLTYRHIRSMESVARRITSAKEALAARLGGGTR